VCWLLSEVVFTFVLIRFDTYNFILFPLCNESILYPYVVCIIRNFVIQIKWPEI